MHLFISIALCFIPLIVIILIASLLIKELSKKSVFAGILAGFGAIIPISIAQYFLEPLNSFLGNSLTSVFITALLFNGLIEEAIKMLFIFFIPGKNKRKSTFFAVALIAGCTFGCFEAVVYLIAGSTNISTRLFTAVLLHTFCAGLSGIYIWTLKNTKAMLSPFLLAVVLHGIYNFFAGFTNDFWWFSVITIVFAIMQCRIYYTKIDESTIQN
ncbi:MAG: hypothetical protein BKP49_02040 [Treponema sp. CETP13]|nr:MAG: hypothetical protein BKP49_02040 [Treponema sp. CETP13]